MSSARHHAEWLSLLEVSGPFLSLPVLMRVFPNELEARDADQAQELKLAYADWSDRGEHDATVHRLWVRYVLDRVLGYGSVLLAEGSAIPPGMEARMAEYGETLRPDFAVVHRATGIEKPEVALLVQVYPTTQKLDSPVKDRSWKASPDTRMAELLHGAGIALGLVTNGERWMLVHAPRGETTGFASWYSDLWMQEPLALRSFHSLLNCQRLVGVAVGDRLVDLLGESAKDQQEVTDQLGYQVRRAVEVFVQALDKIDQDTNRELLKDVPERDIYNGALTVMMRLVFLFKAEELGLLLLGEELYDANYAVSTLRDQLRERADQHGEEILERRSDAWCRLLTTFRAVYAGTEHDALRLPPYGGTLLDPDRFPFLEGRKANTSWRDTAAQPLAINNRVVLHLLEALQILRIKVPGGGPAEPRRLSFRSLDIEQIGHVYEGLLDHTAKRTNEIILGLRGSRDNESEISLSSIEAISTQGEVRLFAFLEGKTGLSRRALEKALNAENVSDETHLLLAAGGDQKFIQRLQAYVGIIREDSFGQLVVTKPGGLYVTSGSDRRSTGTHYTPRSLTEPIVRHTFEPLVYDGLSEGKPKEQWRLKTPREILGLKICDMAMGSGAFLVQACRYLADRLVEAWETLEKANIDQIIITPEGELSRGSPTERLLPADQAERITIARRFVADRCLYGVDINPMAVEMAKLSLWLITLQRDRPFTFLDHALKCGDSLLGVISVQQVETFSLQPGECQFTFATANLFRYVEQASAKRHSLEELPSNDHAQIEVKNRLHAEAEAFTAKVKALADVLVALELRGLDGEAYENQRAEEAEKLQLLLKRDAEASTEPRSHSANQLSAFSREQILGRRPFHWPLEFPEVFARGGFDAFVGNPPFRGGSRLTIELGTEYRDALVRWLTPNAKGRVDLCIYFILRAVGLCNRKGFLALLATSSIGTGHSKEIGMDRLVEMRVTIFRALSRFKWPGTANVHAAAIWLSLSEWNSQFFLDDKPVAGITTALSEAQRDSNELHNLVVHKGTYFRGVELRGDGFVVTQPERDQLLAEESRSDDVLTPYLNGAEVNRNFSFEPRQWVINFREWPREKAAKYKACFNRVEELVKPMRDAITKQIHEPDFWKFWDKRSSHFESIKDYEKILVRARDSAVWAFVFIPRGYLIGSKVVIFKHRSWSEFCMLQNSIHYEWCLEFGAFLGKTTMTYNPTTDLERFPFPLPSERLESIGDAYHQHRASVLAARQEGLTDTYNHFHDKSDKSVDIVRLRTLQVEMDEAVAAAYGWSDMDLAHGFRTTKQGLRYTLGESACRTILDRLVALNHRRFEEEVKAGLHNRSSKSGKNGSPKGLSIGVPIQETLIPDSQRELF